MFENALELEKSLSKHYSEDVELLKADGNEMKEQIQVLMTLADYSENDPSNSNVSRQDVDRLMSMMGVSEEGDVKLEFGEKAMKQLLFKISPLKRELIGYVAQLKDLLAA
jgi:hypothetical protein